MNSILDDFKIAFRSGNILNQIVVINIVVFLALLGLQIVVGLFMQQGALLDSLTRYLEFTPLTEQLIFQPWSIVTYGFVHYGIFHLFFNMMFLYWFGHIITGMLGQNKILGLYVWGVAAGAVLYLVLYNLFPNVALLGGAAPQMIGASAGVYAVMVGAAVLQPNLKFSIFFIGQVKIKYIAAFYIVFSLAGVNGGNSGGNIAHIGGALLGYLFMKQLQKGNDWSKPLVSFVCWAKSFFKPQPKIKVSYKNEERYNSRTKNQTRRASKPSSKAYKSEEVSQAEIDAILDKISAKGYGALSKEEKQKLFYASKNTRE